MRHLLTAACLCLIPISCAIAQSADSTPPPVRVKVYANEPGLTPPKLLPLTVPPAQIDKCIHKIDGTVELSFLVDPNGIGRNIMFVHPVGSDADAFALKIAAADRFTPGTISGFAVVVAETLKVKIQSCMIETKDGGGKSSFSLRLRSAPLQENGLLEKPPEDAVLCPVDAAQRDISGGFANLDKVGGSVSAPVPLISPDPGYTDEGRENKVKGTCKFSLIVDRQGMPQNVEETQRLGYGLDEKAFEAIRRYRFKPAIKNGEPVPVRINFEVSFSFD